MGVTPEIEPISAVFWAPVLSAFALNVSLYFYAQYKKDNGLVDIMWGILHIVPNLVVLCINNNWNERTILTLSLISVWGIRLSIHIGVRHTGEEDYRYQAMRAKWEAKGKCYYYIAALMFVFVMQALFSLIANCAALYICIYSSSEFYWLDIVGAAVFAFGFIFEAIADY